MLRFCFPCRSQSDQLYEYYHRWHWTQYLSKNPIELWLWGPGPEYQGKRPSVAPSIKVTSFIGTSVCSSRVCDKDSIRQHMKTQSLQSPILLRNFSCRHYCHSQGMMEISLRRARYLSQGQTSLSRSTNETGQRERFSYVWLAAPSPFSTHLTSFPCCQCTAFDLD